MIGIVIMAFMLVVFGQIPINDVLISRIIQSQWRSRVYASRYIIIFSLILPAVFLHYLYELIVINGMCGGGFGRMHSDG